MKQTLKHGLALLMTLVLCISLLPAIQIVADAAEFEYVYDSTGKYIYNWGTRGETATFLTPNAEAFYADGNTYDVLSAFSGGTGTSDAPDSELYDALQRLMASNHKYETSYNATRDLYQYTDCQNSGRDSKVISSFYSGKSVGPAWDGGSTWNREHTWPNSKGLGGNDENDIMMLRPTASSENSSRGNKAYGKSSGYYNPNSESNNTLDLRGDVARIFLYVYVRWGNVNGNGESNASGVKYTTWGSQGVMESLDVLLEWMEADPVDTWEMGRNDSVESITGTRNVFVDYPELAFLLFGAEIPSNMTTPSGEASRNCGHNNFDAGVVTAPTCVKDGYTTYTCQTAGCGYSYKSNVVAATGHDYTNGVCTGCGEAEPVAPNFGVVESPVVGTAYKFGMIQKNVSSTDVYYLAGGMSGYYMSTTTNREAAIDVYLEATTGGYFFYTYVNGTKTYINMVVSGTHVNGAYETKASTVYTFDATSKTLIAQVNNAPYWFGTRNDNTYTTAGPCATSYKGFYCQFYGALDNSGEQACQHSNTKVEGAVAATCTAAGHSGKTVCKDCGKTIQEGQTIPAKGHSYTNGICTGCGRAEPVVPDDQNTAMISFADVTNRIYQDALKQIWEANGITMTNDKAASTADIRDYYNPVRIYANSSVTIECTGMIKLVITCPTKSYAEALINGVKAAYADAEATYEMTNASNPDADTIVTIELAAAADRITFSVAKQTRFREMTVYSQAPGEPPKPVCQHTNTKVEGTVTATCGADGYSGDTHCADCGELLSSGSVVPATGEHILGVDGHCIGCDYYEEPAQCTHTNAERRNQEDATCGADGYTGDLFCNDCDCILEQGEVIPATGEHTLGEDGHCTGCDYYEGAPECLHENVEHRNQKKATCGESGHTGDTYCTDCGELVAGGSVIPATGEHSYDESGSCTVCGHTESQPNPNPSEPKPSEPDSQGSDSQESAQDTIWIWIAVGGAVVIIAAIVIILASKKKKN